MPTMSAPATHAQAETPLGRSFEFLIDQLMIELAEKFNPTLGGLFANWGNLAGSGSDTGRIRRIGGLGFAKAMTAMATETQAGTPSTWTANSQDVTVGRYYLGYQESLVRAILAGDEATLEYIAAGFADSYYKTVRSLGCAEGATFSTNAADATAVLDVDDIINLVALAEQTDGFEGRLAAMLDPAQVSHLRASMRSETALATSDMRFDRDQSRSTAGGFAFRFLDIDFYKSSDVTLSGGDYYGFAFVPGAIGYVVGSRQDIGDVPDADVLPDSGLVISREFTGNQGLKSVHCNALLGVDSLDTSIAPNWLLQSDDGV